MRKLSTSLLFSGVMVTFHPHGYRLEGRTISAAALLPMPMRAFEADGLVWLQVGRCAH